MGSSNLLLYLALFGGVATFGAVLWGLFTNRRSGIVAGIAALWTLLSASLAWYAYAESGSLGWTLGYGTACVISATVTVRHLITAPRA